MMRILRDLIPKVARAYLNNISIKGPKNQYGNKEMPKLPEVRRFMLKHFQNVNHVLTNLKRAKATISNEKSKFYMTSIEIVGFVYNANSRHPSTSKIAAIIKWPDPTSVTEARAFIGVCVYYRI